MAHSINEAIMQRDFSKRQRKILDLILRLSWACQKKYAVIPYQKDFEVVGVSESHIKDELAWMVTSKILFVEGDRYSFNKDFDVWEVSRVKPFRPDRLKQLIGLNLFETSQNGNFDKKETSQFGKCETDRLPKTGSQKFPNSEPQSSQNSNSIEPELASPKAILNKILKLAADKSLSLAFLREEFQGNPELEKLLEYPEDWLQKAFEDAAAHQAHSFAYVFPILERYKAEGGSGAVPGQNKAKKNQVDPDKFIKGKYGHMVQR
jgi:hypothetical protein